MNDRHRHIAHLDPESKLNNYLTVALEPDVIVSARMVRKLRLEDAGDCANDAARVRVVFAGARDPLSSFLDMDLARNMVIRGGLGWQDRYRVMLVGDAFHTPGKNGVHEARKVLVTNPGHTVPDNFDVDGCG